MASICFSNKYLHTHTLAPEREGGEKKRPFIKHPIYAPLPKRTLRVTSALPSAPQLRHLTNCGVARHFQALHFNTIEDDILWMLQSPEAEAQAAA